MKSFGQFCPIAKAAEIFAERWTPLLIRELLMGSHRFSELQVGVPQISSAVLAERLRTLERVGVVVRRASESRRGAEYHLTRSGQELFEVLVRLGEWGQRWLNVEIGEEDADPTLLMWDMHRRVNLDRVPSRRVVVQVDFTGARTASFWLVIDRGDVSLCRHHPGFDVDLYVAADTVALHRVWTGRLRFADALGDGSIELIGPRELTRAFPTWLALSRFAHVRPVEGGSPAA